MCEQTNIIFHFAIYIYLFICKPRPTGYKQTTYKQTDKQTSNQTDEVLVLHLCKISEQNFVIVATEQAYCVQLSHICPSEQRPLEEVLGGEQLKDSLRFALPLIDFP